MKTFLEHHLSLELGVKCHKLGKKELDLVMTYSDSGDVYHHARNSITPLFPRRVDSCNYILDVIKDLAKLMVHCCSNHASTEVQDQFKLVVKSYYKSNKTLVYESCPSVSKMRTTQVYKSRMRNSRLKKRPPPEPKDLEKYEIFSKPHLRVRQYERYMTPAEKDYCKEVNATIQNFDKIFCSILNEFRIYNPNDCSKAVKEGIFKIQGMLAPVNRVFEDRKSAIHDACVSQRKHQHQEDGGAEDRSPFTINEWDRGRDIVTSSSDINRDIKSLLGIKKGTTSSKMSSICTSLRKQLEACADRR
jgi:hypothetical protein